MQSYGPYAPSTAEGDGWSNASNATTPGGGSAVHADGGTTNLVASEFNAGVASIQRVKQITVGFIGAIQQSGNSSCVIDSVQLTLDGVPFGEQQGHGCGTAGGEWTELTFYDLDIPAADVNSNGFGFLVTFYEQNDEPTGVATVSVDAMRITQIQAE